MCAQVSPAPPVGLGILQAAAVAKSTVGLRSASRLPQTDTKVSRQADGLTRKLTAAQNHIAIVGGRARRTAAPTHPRDREILANMRVLKNAMRCGSSNPERWRLEALRNRVLVNSAAHWRT